MVVDVGAAARALAPRLPGPPEALLVLGSGLSGLADEVEDPCVIPYEDVPGFPRAGVVGHAGRFVAGRLAGRSVLVQAGRYHLYEGHPPDVVCAPVRLAHALGARTVLLTNASGGVSASLRPGDLMLVVDHLMWGMPGVLEAGAGSSGPFAGPAMDEPYDPRLRALAAEAAAELGTPLARGVYAAVLGPSFETPAEIRALARCGADAVGMSTVPEVLAARELGMACLAISLVTNAAAGLSPNPLTHEEVLETAALAGARLARLMRRIVRDLPAGAAARSG